MTFEGRVYDLTCFLPHHPGGSEILQNYKDRESIDQAFQLANHSTAAYKMFESIPLIEGDPRFSNSKTWNPDLQKGLLWQIWNSDKLTIARYCEFIHEPRILFNPDRQVKLFESPALELLTKTPWYLIPLVWCPWILYYLSVSNMGTLIFSFSLGMLLWTLTEYILHRFLFHGEETWLIALGQESRVAMITHFLLHGIHHAFP